VVTFQRDARIEEGSVVSLSKPFHRNVRAMKPTPNSGYSGWAYIEDPDYAKNPEHYVRALILIQNDLMSIFEYVEPSEEGRSAYSYRIHALLMRTCVEIEANFKAILEENTATRPALKYERLQKSGRDTPLILL
jgi:hypothetical protein